MRKLVVGLGAAALVTFALPLRGVADIGVDSGTGGAYTTSGPEVQFLKSIRLAGDGVGARVIGHYMYVTSTKDLEIYDISAPEDPQLVSSLALDVEFENEQVPTNGTILGISGQTPCTQAAPVDPQGDGHGSNIGLAPGCLTIWDVRDKAHPQVLNTAVGVGDHTSTCLYDCRYMWGSAGDVTDLSNVLAPDHPIKVLSDGAKGWQTGLPGKSCHHEEELSPGIVLAACQPFMLLSARAEDGGTIQHPKLLATGASADKRFIHSARWPEHGTDRFAIIGGETNFQPVCNVVKNGAFMVWDGSHAYQDGKFTQVDEYRVRNGTYTDGHPPVNALGCSVHWFEEHPTFHNGGLVALAAYESGTRFLQITPEGKIKEVGWFEPVGGGTSAPHWAPNSNVVYAIDYQRGVDVLKWNGSLFVPNSATTPSSSGSGSHPSGSAPNAAAVEAATTTPNTGAARVGLPVAVPLSVLLGVGLVARRRRRRRPQG